MPHRGARILVRFSPLLVLASVAQAQTLPTATLWETKASYDALGRVETVTDPYGGVYRFTYDANSNRTSLTYPNGAKTTYDYDDLNHLRRLETIHVPSGQVSQSYSYQLDTTGRITKLTEHDGSFREYIYDAVYRLTSERISGPFEVTHSWTYDAAGNRKTQAVNGSTPSTTYTYDNRDRLVSVKGATYQWDARGNLTQRPDGTRYVWGQDNRLMAVERPDGAVIAFAFDADGELMSSRLTRPGQQPTYATYMVDTSGLYSHVVAEETEAGLAAFYVRGGDELLAVIRPSGTKYVHSDHLGSVRKLTDAAGNVTDSFAFDAWGNLIFRSGIDPLRYQFAGEPYEPEAGLYYNRARWMDPTTGRFVSMDPWEGDPFRPITLHKYLYAEDDPVNNVDPSGMQSLGITMVTVTINVSLNAMSTFNPAAPFTSVAAALLTGAAETFIPGRVPAKVFQTAWRYATPVAGGLFKFGEAVLVGFKSPIGPYDVLVNVKRGQGAALQAHHILEVRHLRNTFKWTEAQIREAPAQILTQAEHTTINAALVKKLPTGVAYTKQQIWKAYQEVYALYPGYLASIAHLF